MKITFEVTPYSLQTPPKGFVSWMSELMKSLKDLALQLGIDKP
jgi:hypothetical protein